jgi:hypothetical protein
MTRRRSHPRADALRPLLGAAWFCLCTLASAAGLSTTLPNGQTLSVVERSTSGRIGLSFERRYADGKRDRQFGQGGRVDFTMGHPGTEPTAVRSDASGNILVAGVAPVANGSRSAEVTRFLSTGQMDSRWGDQGHVLLSTTSGDSLATDVLPGPDGSLLVVGMVEDKVSQHASIWRVAATGQIDTAFGHQGTMLAAALPRAQVLSIEEARDGALVLAIQTSEDGTSWLEVHRWRSGDAFPLRIARQHLPDDWVGPPSLGHRGDQWFWFDPSEPGSLLAITPLTEPDSPWAPPDLPPAATSEAADDPGHAVMNPYAGTPIRMRSDPSDTGSTSIWFGVAAASLLVAGAAVLRAWHR